MTGYIYIGVIVGWLASLAGAFWYGGHTTENAIKAEQGTVLNEKLAQARENSVIDMLAVADVENENADIRTAAIQRRHALEMDIERKRRLDAEARAASPVCAVRSCGLDGESHRLLVDTIRRANDPKGVAAGVPQGVPGNTGTAGRERGNNASPAR